MHVEEQSAEHLQLEQVGRDIRQWRESWPKLKAMPVQLWDDAASAARTLGVHRVSKALGLNYSALRERVEPGRPKKTRHVRQAKAASDAARGGFVELGRGSLSAPEADETVVETVATDGSRLIIRLRGGAPIPNIVALVSAFREGR